VKKEAEMTQEMNEEALHKVERYLFRLGLAMGSLPAAERDENVREIRAHILDRIDAERGPLAETVDNVVARLGTPEQLATQFERERSLMRASGSFSPAVWLRTTARWALSGVEGLIAFWIAVFGYAFGAAFVIAGLLKPFFPYYIGLFISDHNLTLNRQQVYGEHELLGNYFIPVVMCIGPLLVVATTLLLKWIVARFNAAKHYLRPKAVAVQI
jgi:uncharacterized membrane protein